jgi:lipoate-protein ligase A
MTDRRDRDWRLIREESRSGPMQMALDEVAAETAANGGPRTVRVYRWEPSTLSLGYRQDSGTIDWGYCDREDISVTRRPTGGGGIYHDTFADISYSIVAPNAELPGDLLTCYERLCTPILDALDRMGVDAGFADQEYEPIYEPACYLRGIHPAHDILTHEKKISGNAQYRQRDAVVQHGSVSYAFALDHHLAVFQDHDISAEQFRDRVTTVREQAAIDRDASVAHLEAALREWTDATEGTWTQSERDRATEIAEKKYANDEWNHRQINRI